MKDEKLIKEIAEPIIEQLKSINDKLGKESMAALPQIRFVKDPEIDSFRVGDIEIDDEFLEALQEYIQDELEMMNMPTVLH